MFIKREIKMLSHQLYYFNFFLLKLIHIHSKVLQKLNLFFDWLRKGKQFFKIFQKIFFIKGTVSVISSELCPTHNCTLEPSIWSIIWKIFFFFPGLKVYDSENSNSFLTLENNYWKVQTFISNSNLIKAFKCALWIGNCHLGMMNPGPLILRF